jgi:hypothetical protein
MRLDQTVPVLQEETSVYESDLHHTFAAQNRKIQPGSRMFLSGNECEANISVDD